MTINYDSCKKCGLCTEVCPMKIMKFDENKIIIFKEERRNFCFKCGQCMAVCPESSVFIDSLDYEKDFIDKPEDMILEESFNNLILTRRSVRNFKDRQIPDEILKKIIEAVTFAPPGFPPIKTEITIVNDKNIMIRSLKFMIESYDKLLKYMKNPVMRFFIKKKIGKNKFKTLKKHLVPLMNLRMPGLKNGTEDSITRNAPSMIIFHADRNSEEYRNSIYIAMTYASLSAHSLGIGASMIDLIPPAIENDIELKKYLKIPADNEAVGAIILGYPKFKYVRCIKRKLKSNIIIGGNS